MKAACTFSNTVSLAKMLVRWNERPIPIRQMRCGAAPVMSRPLSSTRPASGDRWPVMRLKRVDLPAPLGPMTAAISPRATERLTPSTAVKPSKVLRTPSTSSIALSRIGGGSGIGLRTCTQALDGTDQGAGDAAGEDEEQDDQHHAHREGPILGVGGDLLVEHDEGGSPDGRPPECAHAAEDGHDQRLGRLGPVAEVGEHAAVEDAEQGTRDAGEEARHHEGGELVGAHVD